VRSRGHTIFVAKDALDEHVATMFLYKGWESAKPEIMEVLDIADPAD